MRCYSFWKRAIDNEIVVDLEFKVGKTKITIKRVVVVEFLECDLNLRPFGNWLDSPWQC